METCAKLTKTPKSSHYFPVPNDTGTIRLGQSDTMGPRLILNLLFRSVNAVPFGNRGQYYMYKSRVERLPTIHFQLADGMRFSMGADDLLHEEVRVFNQFNIDFV